LITKKETTQGSDINPEQKLPKLTNTGRKKTKDAWRGAYTEMGCLTTAA
jgi:hypothetical protein